VSISASTKATSSDTSKDVLGSFESLEVHGFTFELMNIGEDGRRADLKIDSPLGSPSLGAKVELARHPLSIEPEILHPVALPIHKRYNFDLPSLPVVRVEEAIAEKLARYRRTALARDLYDLFWYGDNTRLDEALVRRLWVLKVYRDINSDGRGTPPISPSDVLGRWKATDFASEDIGYLTKPVDLPNWITRVETRYRFLADLLEDERTWCEVNGRSAYAVDHALEMIGGLDSD